MRMKMVCDDRTLAEVANEFLALKKAQKVRERTLNDYKKYIDKFLEQSQNSLDVDVLKIEILEYFADIPKTSPARFNHPYQYLHALFAWAAKQDYIPYNPFEKLELKKVRDEGNVQPAEIKDIQTFLKALDKHNYTELRDYNIVLLIHDYFFAKTLDQVRPGGVIAFVTSRYTMDKQSPEVRRYIAQRAELLGAIRLPNNAFKANAGTDVVSDIIFLQRRDRPIEIEPDWVHLGRNEDGFAINSYFVEHPEMIARVQEKLDSLYTQMETAKAELGKPFPQEQELKEKSARLAQLNIELNIDDRTPMEAMAEIADSELEVRPAVSAKSERPSVLAKLHAPLPQRDSHPKQNETEKEVR